MQVSLVPVGMVDQCWHAVSEGFQKASQRFGGDLTVSDLWIGCRAGGCFLFLVHDETGVHAATVWKPETWGRGQRFRCLALYGHGMRKWLAPLREKITAAAKDAGCTGLVADGRDGWAAVFPEAKKLRAVYEVEIN